MNKKGKTIVLTSSKGGVGKTIFLMNLAGIFATMNKKVLLVDCDLANGAIALNLNLDVNKNIFSISNDIFSNSYHGYENYVTKYQDNIDIVAACKDPRQAFKIDINYITLFLEEVKPHYDVVLVDTTHGLNKNNIMLLDKADTILYMMTNDLMDIKNTKSFMEVMNDIERDNVKVILNNSRDVNLNYFSKYDIRTTINRNIDYTIDKTLYIKNITSFLLEGEIFTLNKSLTFKDKNDLKKLENMATELLEG